MLPEHDRSLFERDLQQEQMLKIERELKRMEQSSESTDEYMLPPERLTLSGLGLESDTNRDKAKNASYMRSRIMNTSNNTDRRIVLTVQRKGGRTTTANRSVQQLKNLRME